MAVCHSSKKTDVKVNLWVTTGDRRNRSTWFKRLSFCKSNPHMLPPPLLWLCSQIMNISWQASDTMPRKIFQGFFFSDRNPGVRECHRGVKSVCGPQAKDRIYDAPVDDIRWIFSFLSGEPLCPPQLINHWAVHSLLSLLKRSVLSVAFCWVEKWFQSAQSASCVLTNCDRFLRLISVELEWLSRGESAWISSVLNAAFSILHCPLAFSSRYLSCFHLCQVSPSRLTKAYLCNSSFWVASGGILVPVTLTRWL